jgi:hypothetical protein
MRARWLVAGGRRRHGRHGLQHAAGCPGQGRRQRASKNVAFTNNFFSYRNLQPALNFLIFIFCCKLTTTRKRAGEHMFHSIPFTPRKVEATESRLKAVYDAAKLGLKGDALALAAGMLPIEYRQLTQLDPVVELAAQKGKADGEIELSKVMHQAALNGDAKAALEILKHQHGWVAKQAISVEVDQRISITGALAEATKRALTVEDAQIIEPSVQHAIDHIQR